MKGEVVYLYAFDVANEIATERIREILSEKPFPFEIRMGKTIPKDVPIYRPLTIALPPAERDSNVGRITLKPFVKIFDVGVISISIEVAFDRPMLADLVPYHRVLLSNGKTIDQIAETICQEVVQSIRPAMVKVAEKPEPPEAYTIFCLGTADCSKDGSVPAWLQVHRREIAALLMEETEGSLLADPQVDEVMSHTLSYTQKDGVVIDWDAAFIVDDEEYYDDIVYVIELANLQLEEFLYIDHVLDRFLNQAYEDLERYYRRAHLMALPSKVLSMLRTMQMDLTRMSDEVTNIAKFSGDWYLARVYMACRDRFHIDRWRDVIREKLQSVEHLYNLANTEITNRRMLLLEGIIVVLFIADLLLLIFTLIFMKN
ncbi:MAG: hypothetical protein HYY16_06735 [Planctomycetes bacterium]|nr:hypothetical protein [Planctomycetota bacterium]